MMGASKDLVDKLDEITKWPLLLKSSLDIAVLMNIESNFASFPGLSCGIIQARSVALLEEISPCEAIRAVEEFCTRYRWASHKIHRSVSGYFRGVCKKYWKLNREARKQELKQHCEDASQERKLKIIDATVDILFTKASELCKDLVDAQKRSLLLKFDCSDAIEALYEFCNAAMYREHKIRSMHAYLLNIIKRREIPAGSRMSKSNYFHHKGHHRPNSAKSSRERTREQSPISQRSENDILLSADEIEGASNLSPSVAQDMRVDIQRCKSVEHHQKGDLRNLNTPGGGKWKDKENIPRTHERQNSLDPKDWEPAVLPSKALTPSDRYRDEQVRHRGGNYRRPRKNRRRYPFGQRGWRSGHRDERWNMEKQEIDPLSSIAMRRAEFTSGGGGSPPAQNPADALMCLCDSLVENDPQTTKKPHLGKKDCDLVDPRLAEPFLGMLENTELEPGPYLPRILDPRFASLTWQHTLQGLSPLE